MDQKRLTGRFFVGSQGGRFFWRRFVSDAMGTLKLSLDRAMVPTL